jgi:CHRD domain.
MSKKIIFIALFFVFAVSAAAQQRFAANLSGRQQVPPNESAAGATCSFVLNADEIHLAYNCTAYGISGQVTSVRIHGEAGFGETAPPLFTLTNAGLPGLSSSASFPA